jgi:phosphate transport system permease protein
MPLLWTVTIILVLGAIGYMLGRRKAIASAGGDARRLHSLPGYYGTNALILTVVPALLVLAVWLIIQPLVVERSVTGLVPDSIAEEMGSRGLVMTEVRRLAEGLDTAIGAGALSREEVRTLSADLTDIRSRLGEVGVALGSDVTPDVLLAAQEYRSMTATGQTIMTVVVLILAALGLAYAYARTHQEFRARNSVEYAILALLMLASTIAILTTVGIVLSMLFETFNFFELYPWREFFFGLEWRPSFEGGSDLGLIPLLWGTLYVSFIALLVAVPIGLFAAVYMAEYASPRMRSFAKPLIEILAGIPTIVYGLFALITVGPMLRDYFAEPLGLGTSSSSVMTAGIVMGIMLIPFVSSLSDDIINAVPKVVARRLLRAGRHAIRNDQAGDPARRPAGHRGRRPACRLPRHRRDDDRGVGGRGRRKAQSQSVRGHDHRHGEDRGPADRATRTSKAPRRWWPLRLA